jgi:hypothetical protein
MLLFVLDTVIGTGWGQDSEAALSPSDLRFGHLIG